MPRQNSQPLAPVVVSRRRAAEMLGVDVSTLRRWEASGLLRPVRLNKRSPNAHVCYRLADVLALVEGEEPSGPLQVAKAEASAPSQPRRERLREDRRPSAQPDGKGP